MKRGRASRALALALVLMLLPVSPAQAGNIDFQPFGLPLNQLKQGLGGQTQPIQLQHKKDATLEELLPRASFNYSYLQPVPLGGVRIPGLGNQGLDMLGYNYFVVVNNTKYDDFASIYRENRLKGKSNFVTVDAILHPYLAFTNSALGSAIVHHIVPELTALLKAMLEVSIKEYKQADDTEVRDDIEHNTAFLTVAVQLLEPSFAPTTPGRAAQLAKSDMEAINAGRKTRSAIFDREEDFSLFQPIGWYNASPQLQNFYKCREWVSRMGYPLTDVTFGIEGGHGNNFRRSVLLFRCLDLATVHNRPAFEKWSKLETAWALMGSPLAAVQEGTLSPKEYKSVMQVAPSDLKVTLSALAEPFFRTKLMLTIRKQRPVQLDATSIWDLDDVGASGAGAPTFRLFPVTGDPEWPWLKATTKYWKEDGAADGAPWPLALFVLHGWGSGQANNILADNAFKLDPMLAKLLPGLERSITRRQPGGRLMPVEDRRWQILSTLFQPFGEGAQSVLRTEAWLNRTQETAFAAWVDSHLAYAQESAPDPAASAAQPPGTASSTTHAAPGSQSHAPPAGTGHAAPAGATHANVAGTGHTAPAATTHAGATTHAAAAPHQADEPPAKAVRQATYHYLEPCPELYRKIKEDAARVSENLYLIGYLPEKTKERFNEFMRFMERLQRITDLELRGEILPQQDMKLLGHIDVFLEKVVYPLPGTLTISPQGGINPGASGSSGAVSLGLGRAGQLYIILSEGVNKTTLARGAVYTYYELPGGPIKPEHWARKLQFDLIKPPTWAGKFDIVQQALPAADNGQKATAER